MPMFYRRLEHDQKKQCLGRESIVTVPTGHEPGGRPPCPRLGRGVKVKEGPTLTGGVCACLLLDQFLKFQNSALEVNILDNMALPRGELYGNLGHDPEGSTGKHPL